MPKFKKLFLLLLGFLLLFSFPLLSREEVHKYKLENGLTVLVREVKLAPVVSVFLGFKVGSRNENLNIAGISHQLEHMLFKGTRRFPPEAISTILDASGANFNAFTSQDLTGYWETLPKQFLQLALKIEADRMENSVIDPEELKREKGVVLSELKGIENYPEWLLYEEMQAISFKAHPYHIPVIGYESTVKNYQREDLVNYYKTYYVPENAVLAIVGDVELEQVKKQVAETFGKIPSGKTPPGIRVVEPAPRGERRIKIYTQRGNPFLSVGFLAPGVKDADIYPLTVLDTVLTGGGSSRLYKRLVQGELATSVYSYLDYSIDPNLWSFNLTLRPTTAPEKIEEVLWEEFNRLKEKLLEPGELEKVKNKTKAEFYRHRESLTQQAEYLGQMELVDSHQFLFTFEAKIDQVTQEDIKRVAEKFLNRKFQNLGLSLPENPEEEAAEPAQAPQSALPNRFFAQKTENPGKLPVDIPMLKGFKLGFTRHLLSNGTVVLVKENPAAPTVSLQGYFQGGISGNEIPGTANFVAGLLLRGAGGKSWDQIFEKMDYQGSRLEFNSKPEQLYFTGWSLSSNLKDFLPLVKDCLFKPDFPEDQINKARAEILAKIRRNADDPGTVAYERMLSLIYPPGHPFHYSYLGSKESLEKINRPELSAYHQKFFRPDNLVLAVVGAVNTQELISRLEELFADCPAPSTPFAFKLPEAPQEIKTQREVIAMPDKARIEIYLGKTGISRPDSGYDAFELMNYVLGGSTLTARLGKMIRDKKGLAYGVFSSQAPSREAAPWFIYMGIRPGDEEYAVKLAKAEIKKIMDEPVSEEELKLAKLAIVNSMPATLETNYGLAKLLLYINYFNLGDDYLEKFAEIYSGLKTEDVQKIARQYLSENLVEVLAGPVKEK